MTDLVTLAEVKQFAGIANPNSDAAINDLIPKATAMVRNYCNRNFIDYYDSPKLEIYSGGKKSFFLQELPVVNILNIEYSQDYGQNYTTLVEFVDFVYNQEDETVDVLGLSCFPKIINGYRITYMGGHQTAPADLKQATIDIILYYMKSDMAVKSTRSPGSSATQVEYIVNATLPSHIRRVLDSYRIDL